MPYTTSDPSALPSHVQKMDARDRRRWVQVWNAAFTKATREGKTSKDAETSAFAAANGVVSKLAQHSSFADDAGGDEGHWVTIDGQHVQIGKGGKILAGGSHLGGVGATVGHPQPKESGGSDAQHVLKDISLKGEPNGDGSLAHPIDVGGDLNKAVSLLAEGKHIRLNQADEVSTLLDKLAARAQEAKANGEKAANIDLGNVTVVGQNLFVTDHKGLSRVQMPQLMGKPLAGSPASSMAMNPRGEVDLAESFRAALAKVGVTTSASTAQASHLRATQTELDGSKVAGMMKSMEKGTMPEAPIFVTKDNYILDGHHRWAAVVGVDARDNALGDVTMPVTKINMDIGAALDFSKAFAAHMGIPQASAFSLFRGSGPITVYAEEGSLPLWLSRSLTMSPPLRRIA